MLKYILCAVLLAANCLNPVRAEMPAQEKVQQVKIEPHILVLFGATGDLTQRKLIPALFSLFKQGLLPENFILIGTGTEERSLEVFHKKISPLQPITNPAELSQWNQFLGKCFYHKVKMVAADFENLHSFVDSLEKKYGTKGNRLFYLATPSSAFLPIIQNLHDQKLVYKPVTSTEAWSRVIIEKPFGRDLESAEVLKGPISQQIDPSQTYLIDHYLGKELVKNMLTLRFSNPLFTKIWNRDFIEKVEITISEDLGIEGRGKFWEETGLLRDIVQNHLIQLVALAAMETPEKFNVEDIRNQKVKALEAIRPFDLADPKPQIVRAQYTSGKIQGKPVPGYREEEHVNPASNVESFVAAKILIDNERWEGVPFYVHAGKRLAERLAEIKVTFKDSTLASPNQLVIRVQPNEEIYLTFNSSLPGTDMEAPFKLHFNYKNDLGARIPDAYETLLAEAMLGHSQSFVRIDEIMASWRLFDPVLKKWSGKEAQDLLFYPAGSKGPDLSW